jgi:hypothetical protein
LTPVFIGGIQFFQAYLLAEKIQQGRLRRRDQERLLPTSPRMNSQLLPSSRPCRTSSSSRLFPAFAANTSK